MVFIFINIFLIKKIKSFVLFYLINLFLNNIINVQTNIAQHYYVIKYFDNKINKLMF